MDPLLANPRHAFFVVYFYTPCFGVEPVCSFHVKRQMLKKIRHIGCVPHVSIFEWQYPAQVMCHRVLLRGQILLVPLFVLGDNHALDDSEESKSNHKQSDNEHVFISHHVHLLHI